MMAGSTLWSRVTGLLGHLRPRSARGAEVRLHITNLTRQVEIGDRIEIADNGVRRRKGLLGRSDLAPGEGLWIVPCEAVHTFGMQFPIDLVYLDRSSRVVKTRTQVKPGRLSACFSAHSVVELPPGTVRSTLTEAGDQLQLIKDTFSDTSAPAAN